MTGADLRIEVLGHFRPPPRLSVTEWADSYRRLSQGSSAEHGRYRSARTPYARGIMDAVSDPDVTEVWFMKSAQVGATEVLNNICGYHIDQDPSTILVMHPTVEMGQAWSKDRLAPMVRDTPRLRDKVRIGQTKDGSSTMLHKKFAGGHLTVVGANSPAGLASRPIRVILCDEVDRYPASAGDEGDPVSLAKVRSTTYWNRKFFACSTPTIKDVSRIEKGYDSGDQRHYLVPCKHCGHKQRLRWEQLDFSDGGSVDDPVYRCEECGGEHREPDKRVMLDGGEWVAHADFTGIASFHINALYSPWKSWGSVVADFLAAKKGGPEMLKTWKNTMMGECYEERGDSIDGDLLAERATVNILHGDKVHAPDGVLVATWGADVQHDRIEIELVGWGIGEESWSLDYQIINGAYDNPLTWHRLDEFLACEWTTAGGRVIDVPVGGIDTGDGNTNQWVLNWVRPRMGLRRGALPFKGANTFTAPIWQMPSSVTKTARDAIVKPYMIGVSQAKLVIYERLQMTEPGAGYMHFPSHYDRKYFKGLTSERLITKYDKGFPRKEWILPGGRGNEPLDCRVYALAAMKILNPDWDALARRAGMQERTESSVKQPFHPAHKKTPVTRKSIRIKGFR